MIGTFVSWQPCKKTSPMYLSLCVWRGVAVRLTNKKLLRFYAATVRVLKPALLTGSCERTLE